MAFDLGSAIAGVVGPVLNFFGQRETNEANERLANERNALQERLWREQAAYNTPASQMQRLRDAGLNPNLAYGQVADSKMAMPPDMVVPRMENELSGADAMGALVQYQQVKNMQVLNAKQNIELRKAKAEAVQAESQAQYTKYENDLFMRSGITKNDTPWWRMFRPMTDLFSSVGSAENAHRAISAKEIPSFSDYKAYRLEMEKSEDSRR